MIRRFPPSGVVVSTMVAYSSCNPAAVVIVPLARCCGVCCRRG
ncbi:hypothetical protein ACK366_18170 [Aeromonas veronii]|nr:hypothetical protein [Aeromonas veronii]